MTTTLPAVLRDIDADRASIGRTAPVIAVPLLLLCWFVLFLLVASLTEERAPEIALAKLRGYPSGRAARFGLGEVLLLTAAAVPAGIVAGLLLVQAAAGALLADGVRVEVRWPVFAAAGIALAAGLAAAVLAGRQTLARPVLGLLRRVPERGGWRAGVAEGVVVALAVASLAAAVNDRGSPSPCSRRRCSRSSSESPPPGCSACGRTPGCASPAVAAGSCRCCPPRSCPAAPAASGSSWWSPSRWRC